MQTTETQIQETELLAQAIRELFRNVRKDGISAKIIRKNCGCRACGCKACEAEHAIMETGKYLFTDVVEGSYAYIHKGGVDFEAMRKEFDKVGLVCTNWNSLNSFAFRVELQHKDGFQG